MHDFMQSTKDKTKFVFLVHTHTKKKKIKTQLRNNFLKKNNC